MDTIDITGERAKIQLVASVRRLTRARLIGDLSLPDYKARLAELLASYPGHSPSPACAAAGSVQQPSWRT